MKRKLNRNLLRRLVMEGLNEGDTDCKAEAAQAEINLRYTSPSEKEHAMPSDGAACYKEYKEVFAAELPDYFGEEISTAKDDDDAVAVNEVMTSRRSQQSYKLDDYDLISEMPTATAAPVPNTENSENEVDSSSGRAEQGKDTGTWEIGQSRGSLYRQRYYGRY